MSKNEGFVKRVLDYISFAFMAFFVGLFQKFDVIVATSPQFFTTWAGCGLAKIKRRPWVFELRDLWPESIKTVGAMKQGKIIEILEKIELGLYKSSNLVIAVTEAFRRNLIARGIDGNKIKVITNGSNLDLFVPRGKDGELLNQLGLKDKFIVGYIGTHGMAHSLDFIITTISKIKDEKFHFLFVGDGAVKEKIVNLAADLGLKNVTFLGSVPKDEVPRFLSICDAMLAPLKKDDNFKTVIPSKIFEASAMQRPVLLGVKGQAKEILEAYGAGVCFEPENEKDFIEKLNNLTNVNFYNECKVGCLRLANDYDRKKLAKTMLEILKTLP